MRQTARCCCCWLLLSAASAVAARAQNGATPLSIGQTFSLVSAVLGESRRINVYQKDALLPEKPFQFAFERAFYIGR